MWDNLFDKTFRDSANEGLPSLDKSAMWNNLEKDLDKRKRVKGLAWVWFFGGLLLLSSLAYVATKNHQIFVNDQFVDVDANPTAKAENVLKTDAIQKLETDANTVNPNENKIQEAVKEIISNNKNDQPINNTATLKNSVAYLNQAINTVEPNIKTSPAPTTNEVGNELNIIPITNEVVQIDESSKDNPEENLEQVANSTSRSIMNVKKLPGLLAFDYNATQPAMVSDRSPIKVTPSKLRKWTLTIAAGASLFNKTITSENAELEEFVNFKNENEAPIVGLNANLKLGYKLNKNFEIRGGLNYMSFYEWFDYNGQTQEDVVAFSENAYSYEKSDGTVVTFSGDVPAIRVSGREISHNNQHQMLGLSLEGAYRKKLGKIYADINTGVLTMVSHNFNGKTIDFRGEPIAIDDDTNISEAADFGGASVFWTAGVGIEIPLSRKISLKPDFTFTRSLNAVNNSAEYKQLYNFYSGNIGLRYSF